MANVIIFTDRAPKTMLLPGTGVGASSYNYPAGSYKIASVVRNLGLEALVVNNCFSLTFKGVQEIINNNKDDLLWVGIGSTLMFVRSNMFDEYRTQWHNSNESTIDLDPIFGGSGGSADSRTFSNKSAATEMVWSTGEIERLSKYCEDLNAPLLIGGSWVTYMRNGNFGTIHKNTHLIKGYAEQYVKEFTLEKIKDPTSSPPYIVSNSNYDSQEFKESSILYSKHDLISPENWLPLEIARGCAFNCAYCNFDHRNSRDSYKNTTALREELLRNYEEYGVTSYMLVDDLYNDSKTKIRDLYDNVWSKLPFDVEWVGYMRLDMFWADPESIEIVKASGARMGSFGIETLHNKAGAKVGKGLGKERILETLHALKEKWGDEVLVASNFIAGLPYEDRESIQETIDWSANTDLLFSSQWSPLWITPPEHFNIVTEESLTNLAKDPDKWEIKWISPGNWINSAGLTFEEVDKMCVEARAKMPDDMKMIRSIFGFFDYADLRSVGMTHRQIVDKRYGRLDPKVLYNINRKIQQRVEQRLEYWLQVKV